MNLVSFSLWGDDPKYLRGAIENVKRGREIYDGWIYRFYIAANLNGRPEINKLQELGAEVHVCVGNPSREGLYWRMWPVFYAQHDIVAIRDADSRPSMRERSCVTEFEQSDAAAHTIRDHRCHTTAIMGGLWACRPARIKGLLPHLRQSFDDRLRFVRTAPDSAGAPKHGHMQFSDQDWLQVAIYDSLPECEMLCHDDWKRARKSDRPIKTKSSPMDFCGQIYSAEGVPVCKL